MTGAVQALLDERLSHYVKVRGGVALPVAGAIYWAALGILGSFVTPAQWCLIALYGSGAIFPLGLLIQKPLGSDVISRTPLSGMIAPALAGALIATLPLAILTFWYAKEFTPLVLAIGLTVHWPAIGWFYGRTFPYYLHAAIRVVACVAIWYALPEARFTLLPLAVGAIYLLTAIMIMLDVPVVARKLKK